MPFNGEGMPFQGVRVLYEDVGVLIQDFNCLFKYWITQSGCGGALLDFVSALTGCWGDLGCVSAF